MGGVLVGVRVGAGLLCKIVCFGSLDSTAACRGAMPSKHKAKYIAGIFGVVAALESTFIFISHTSFVEMHNLRTSPL